ncbi:MAG TPA: hypothetical protein VIL03_02005 [Clostridia bacterium]|jgi:hypothetical protein
MRKCPYCCPQRRSSRRNQVRCYVFISSTNVPVRGAIVSCTFCNSGRVIYRRTDVFGTAVFNLPDGDYLCRCECVPSFLSPSTEDFYITLNSCCCCEADLLFPARVLGTNAINQQPLVNTQNTNFNQQPIINTYTDLLNNSNTFQTAQDPDET